MRIVSSLYFFVQVLTFSFAQSDSMQEYAEALTEHPYFQNAFISATAIDIKTGEVIVDLNGKRTLIPASSLKVITNYTALYELGGDYRYETQLAYTGKILSDGTLEGNIYVIGSGDPSLGSSNINGVLSFYDLLTKWTKAIQKIGITCIAGKVICDESIFNSFPVSPSWQWNDLGNYYACGTWGINIHDNQYFVFFKQTEKEGGLPRIVRFTPYVPDLVLVNEVTTGKANSGDNAYIFGGPYDFSKRIIGTIPPGSGNFVIKGSIPDPPLFFAYQLKESLEKIGIQVDGFERNYIEERKPKRKTIIHKVFSPTLENLARHANFKSDNLVCESLLKTLGHEKEKVGSGIAGKKVIFKFMKDLKVPLNGLRMDDGSGLSARNRISSATLAIFMQALARTYGIANVCDYLPQGGINGTLRGMFKGSTAMANIWAKSGSMEDVSSYTGFVKTAGGRWLSFSILVNGYSEKNNVIRPLLEEFMVRLHEQL